MYIRAHNNERAHAPTRPLFFFFGGGGLLQAGAINHIHVALVRAA